MSNIPLKERRDVPRAPQPQAYKNGVQQMRPVQQSRANQPQVRQMQRPTNMPPSRTAQPQNMRHMAPRSSAAPQGSKPKQPQKSVPSKKKSSILQRLFGRKTKQSAKKRSAREHTGLGDFLLAFFIAFVFFGIAAIIVCNALISMFT